MHQYPYEYCEFGSPILFVTVYLDDVCIYSRTLEEHLEHLRLVLQRLKEEGLKLRLKKCFFGLQEMEYLGYTVSAGNISVSTKKVEAVADRPVPKTQKEVRSFVEFCNFYARFIHHFRSFGRMRICQALEVLS
jgi:hypothetical protein